MKTITRTLAALERWMALAAISCAWTMPIFANAFSKGGTDEEILEWCFEKGRRLNEGDMFVWNAFASKLGWRDRASELLEERKQKCGIADRTDIVTIADFIDFDEGRFAEGT